MREDSDWRDKSRIQFFEKLIERLLPDGIVLPDYTELDLNVGSLPQKEFAEAFVTVRKKHAEAIACNEAEPRAHWPGSRANALRRLRLPLLTYPSSNSAITPHPDRRPGASTQLRRRTRILAYGVQAIWT